MVGRKGAVAGETRPTKKWSVVIGWTQIMASKADVSTAEARQVNVKRGDTVQLQVPYEFKEESSKQKDHWSFTLDCTLARMFSEETPKRDEPVTMMFDDRWGRNDAKKGTLEKAYRLTESGDYSVAFEIQASHTKQPWGDAKVGNSQRRTASGVVRIHVDD